MLQKFVAFIGIGDATGLFVQFEMLVRECRDHHVNRIIQFRAVLGRAGYDQRRAGLVDQNAVHFVDNGKVVVFLEHLGQFRFHVVAQVIKAKFVVGAIGDVAAVSGYLVLRTHVGPDDAGAQTQRIKHLAHPFRITLGQVFVHRDHMHALAGQRIQIGRKGGDQGLAFAGLHLGNVALMQENAAHELHVKGPQAQRPPGGLAAIGIGLGQQVGQLGPLCHPFDQLFGLGLQPVIAQLFELGFKRVDLFDQRSGRLDFTVIRRAEHLFGDCFYTQHAYSSASD